MDKLDWQPGENGKGIVDEHGDVHAWNEDDYSTHKDYLREHPNLGSPKAYFYIDPDGKVDVSHPSAGYDRPGYHLMTDYICEADPHFTPEMNSWTF